MRLVILEDSNKVAEWSAKYVLKRINDFKPGPDKYFVLGLPTGLPRDHPESYHFYMWNNFFKHIDIDPRNAHLLNGNAPNLEEECENFERKISEAGGINLFVGAKEAACLPPEASLGVMFLDLKGYVRHGVLCTWHEQWVLTPAQNKQRSIRDGVSLWPSSIQKSRKEEVIGTRLCVFLLRGDPPPVCEFCDAPHNFYHILVECRKYAPICLALDFKDFKSCDLQLLRSITSKNNTLVTLGSRNRIPILFVTKIVVKVGGLPPPSWDMMACEICIGPDGHIAFNEPGSSLVSRTRVKTLAQDTLEANARFFGNDISKVPKQALTVGVGTVMDAEEVMILITGTHKAFALYKAIEEGVNHMWTVSAFQQHRHTIMICDEDATLELRVKTVKYFKALSEVHQRLIEEDMPAKE
uniref:(California timema) hypothetical protein n=1 Tax=Timema californicum TaxID=61474 RepID=A0A7R9PA63_TIMCA|nr:unnamed protein product [Timema californicum]